VVHEDVAGMTGGELPGGSWLSPSHTVNSLGAYEAGMLKKQPWVSKMFWQKSGDVIVGSQALKQNSLPPTKLLQLLTWRMVVLSLEEGKLLEKTRPPSGFPARSAPWGSSSPPASVVSRPMPVWFMRPVS